MPFLERYLREPVNSLTHLAGAVAALAGMLTLIWLTRDEPGKMISMIIYGVSLVALLLASALYHGVSGPAALRGWLNRLDHATIFFLIAGTYTPIVYNLYPAATALPVLALIWIAALIGAGFKIFSRRIHGLINVSIYVILGWGGMLPLLLTTAPGTLASLPGLKWLLIGGLVYSLGFVIYYWRRPDPWPNVFGHHEIWHLFVLTGAFCHFLFILWYVAPAPA